MVLSDLAEFTHLVTRLKLAPDSARSDTSLSEVERVRGGDFADRLSVRALSRAWQILLKAIPEVQAATRPLAAAEMALVRLIYAADLPTPDEALRQVREGGSLALPARAPNAAPSGASAVASPPARAAAPAVQAAPAPVTAMRAVSGAAPALRDLPEARAEMPPAAAQARGPAPSPAMPRPTLVPSAPAPQPAPQAAAASKPETGPRLRRFEDVVALADERRDIGLKMALERDAHLVRFEDGRIELRLAEGGRATLATDLANALHAWTGRRWVVALSQETGEATLDAQAKAAVKSRHQGAASHPLVQAVLKNFPGAQIVDVRDKAPDPPDPGDAAPSDSDDPDL